MMGMVGRVGLWWLRGWVVVVLFLVILCWLFFDRMMYYVDEMIFIVCLVGVVV